MIDALVEQIKVSEGFRERPYQCSEGVWTFGHGLTYITEEESEIIVRMRLYELEERLKHRLAGLSPQRKIVLIDMAFNLGVAGLMKFKKMLAAVDRQDWETAANEMLDSKWAKQVGTRAVKLATMMRQGR